MSDKILSMTPEEAYEAGYTAGSMRDWTPCDEGLPEDDPNFSPMSRYECTILIPDRTREVFTLQRTENGRWLYETGKGMDTVRGDQVAAWRNISEPYNPNKKIEEDAVADTQKDSGGENHE